MKFNELWKNDDIENAYYNSNLKIDKFENFPNISYFLKATSTPLASIFGSSFLVIIPILEGAVGPYSIWAVIVMCIFVFF